MARKKTARDRSAKRYRIRVCAAPGAVILMVDDEAIQFTVEEGFRLADDFVKAASCAQVGGMIQNINLPGATIQVVGPGD